MNEQAFTLNRRALLAGLGATSLIPARALAAPPHRLKLGELEIGRGAVYWWGRSRKTAKRISWSRVAEHLDEIAYG